MPHPHPTSSPSPAPGSARPTTTRRARAASAPTASAWCAASVASCTASEAEALPAYTRDWAEAQGRETLLEAARRHLIEIPKSEASPATSWSSATAPGHSPSTCAIMAHPTTMIHALEGAPVCEVALSSWWRRHLAAAFVFPER